MTDNGEVESEIQFVVNDFKSKYGTQKKKEEKELPSTEDQPNLELDGEKESSSDIVESSNQSTDEVPVEKDDEISTLNDVRKKSSYTSELWRSLQKGSVRLGRDIAATPEFLYDILQPLKMRLQKCLT